MPIKINRFHGNREVRGVLRQAKTLGGDGFSLRIKETEQARLAVIVSKKVHKHAVVRNRIRRRVSSIINDLRSDIALTDDVIIIARDSGLSTENYQVLRQKIAQALSRKR